MRESVRETEIQQYETHLATNQVNLYTILVNNKKSDYVQLKFTKCRKVLENCMNFAPNV